MNFTNERISRIFKNLCHSLIRKIRDISSFIYSHYPEGSKMPFDARNGPARVRETPYEMVYQTKKTQGEYQDRYSRP